MIRGSNKPQCAKFLCDVTRMTSVTNITSITAFADSGQPNLETRVSLVQDILSRMYPSRCSSKQNFANFNLINRLRLNDSVTEPPFIGLD